METNNEQRPDENSRDRKQETNEEAPNKEFIGAPTTQRPPGRHDFGKDTPLTPERAAEGDRDDSDAV